MAAGGTLRSPKIQAAEKGVLWRRFRKVHQERLYKIREVEKKGEEPGRLHLQMNLY